MFGRALRRLRSRCDVTRYVLVQHWPLAVGLIGLTLAIAPLLPPVVGALLSVVGLVLSLLLFGRDLLQARRRSRRYSCVAHVGTFPLEGLRPPIDYPSPTYVVVPGLGTMMVDDLVDEALPALPLRVVVDEPYRLPVRLRELLPLAIREERRGRVAFDGPILGLRDDPVPLSPSRRPLRLVPTTYFRSIASVEMCKYIVVDRHSDDEWDIRRLEIVDPAGRLISLAGSRLANTVGISTLAVTMDDLTIIVRQSAANVGSPRLLAPSGSGSLEPADAAAVGPRATLQDIVAHGMERELREETGLRPADLAGTQVLGFGRWLERGARPEFFGLTRLSINSAELRRRRIASTEEIFTDGVHAVYVDFRSLSGELATGTDLHLATSIPVAVRRAASMPLFAALRAAANARTGS